MNTRTQALVRAAGILGGAEPLAEHLGISRQAVRAMLSEHLPVPHWIFLRTIDVITDALTAEVPAV